MSFDLTGAIDLHVHSSPDVYPRILDDLALAKRAEAAGMRALLLKSHHTLTADRAKLVSQHVSIEVFGGLALNLTVGGLNPVAVETAIAFGARQIWLPTIHARHCLATANQQMFRQEAAKGRQGITAVDADGKPAPELWPILEQIRDADIILGTGHIAPAESLIVLREAKAMGITKLLVTHPQMSFTSFTIPEMKEAASQGAFLELDALSCAPKWHESVPPREAAQAIQAIGPNHCVIATDGGQPNNPEPPQMLSDFAESLQAEGIDNESLTTMMCKNPARLLNL